MSRSLIWNNDDAEWGAKQSRIEEIRAMTSRDAPEQQADPHVLLGRIIDAATDLAHVATRYNAKTDPLDTAMPSDIPDFVMPNEQWLARWFHATYERLAPRFGYQTRAETHEFDPDSPNGKLMLAVCKALKEEIEESPLPKIEAQTNLGDLLGRGLKKLREEDDQRASAQMGERATLAAATSAETSSAVEAHHPEQVESATPRTDDFIASLPLDWTHFPADATEGWDMLVRAKTRYDLKERENADLRQQLAEAADLAREHVAYGQSARAKWCADACKGKVEDAERENADLLEKLSGEVESNVALRIENADLRRERDSRRCERDELRRLHDAGIKEAYRICGVEDDGEYRWKWVLLELSSLKRRAKDAERLLADAQNTLSATLFQLEEAERLAKIERDKKEAEEREAKRQAAELLDAAAMLATFKERFGHLPKYAKVVKAIDAVTAIDNKGKS